jgi:hypothetical protein
MMFIPNDDALEAKCRAVFEQVATAENFKVGAAACPNAACRACQDHCGRRNRGSSGWSGGPAWQPAKSSSRRHQQLLEQQQEPLEPARW